MKMLHSHGFHIQASATEVPVNSPLSRSLPDAVSAGLDTVGICTYPTIRDEHLFCLVILLFMVSTAATPHQLPGIQVSIWEAKDASTVYSKTERTHFSPLGDNVFLTDPKARVSVLEDIA